ncbi:MAG: TRAP transporter TatT component family protein [Bacteroidia bacterium]
MRRVFLGLLTSALLAQEDPEALWRERDNPEKAQQLIPVLEAALQENPHQPEKVMRLARLYYLIAEQTEEKSKKLELYDKAFRACRAELAYQVGLPSEAKDAEIVKKATAEHLPVLYWAAASIARWAKNAAFAQRVKVRPTIRLYWDRIMEIQPDYFHGGGYRFFGGYYALVPAITGEQDVNKSKEMFEKSLSVAPYYLETKVLYAEAYATHGKVRDRELFRRLLKEVLEADPGTDPDYAAENRLAKKKAQRLQEREKEFFD